MLEPDRQDDKRKNLAEVLRELRLAAGLSGQRLAVRCAMSQGKISRIETGKILPSVMDVERILKALRIEGAVVDELLHLARRANVDYTSVRVLARIGLWQQQEDLRALDESSLCIRHFLPAIPTGLLQIEDYARCVLTPTVTGRPARDVERVLRARMARQEILGDAERQFTFILTEQAVRWCRASAEVMARQVQHLADVSRKKNVEIAIVCQSTPVPASPLSSFVVYDERLVRVEMFSGSVALRDPRDVAYHLNIFQFFLDHALTGELATEFLRSVAREFG
ncbi:helix-turn-helix domain-containing protein [Amycolatopsis nigrescens]|uniref:helix-turn-helix domain-containing protein n=1 Tax=Amycolatopsis nigrescens TaxID=381445 RepID=UPI000380327F|nr:helix-turn-helix transcriptional regulator [Amycolatopsis nigrescens]